MNFGKHWCHCKSFVDAIWQICGRILWMVCGFIFVDALWMNFVDALWMTEFFRCIVTYLWPVFCCRFSYLGASILVVMNNFCYVLQVCL